MKDAIIECCNDLLTSRSQHTGFAAAGIKHTFENPDFELWLNFFAKIMPHVDLLYAQMQSRLMNSASANAAINNFNTSIQKIRDKIGSSTSTLNIEAEGNEPRCKRRCSNYIPDAKEVCDILVSQCNQRFQFKSHLSVSQLLQKDKFPSFIKCFPDETLDEVVTAYPGLDKSKLKTELSVLYERKDMWAFTNVVALSKTIVQDNLHQVFSETLKLLKILVVTPMATAEPERCFSILKRIKTFLRSTMTNERLSALGMLSIEKNMIAEIKNFNEKVMDHFASVKNRRMEFIFKWIICFAYLIHVR